MLPPHRSMPALLPTSPPPPPPPPQVPIYIVGEYVGGAVAGILALLL